MSNNLWDKSFERAYSARRCMLHPRIGYDKSLISPMLEAELATFQFGGVVLIWVCHQLSRSPSDDCPELMLVWRPVIGRCIHVYAFLIQTIIALVAQSLKDLWLNAFQSCQPGNLQNHPFFQLTSTIFPLLRVMFGGFVSMCDRVSLVDRFYLMRQLQNPSNPSFFDPIRVCWDEGGHGHNFDHAGHKKLYIYMIYV